MTNTVFMKEVETKEDIEKLMIGKTIKAIKYEPGYCDIDIIFTDDTYISICAEDAFDFRIEIPEIKEI